MSTSTPDISLHFPSPPSERISLMMGALVAVAWPFLGVYTVLALADAIDQAPGDVLARWWALRVMLGASVVALVVGALGLWSFARLKWSARAGLRGGVFYYHRLGVPLTGWGGYDIELPAEAISFIGVGVGWAGAARRVELHVRGAGQTVVMNLGHAVPPTSLSPPRKFTIDEAPAHPLVQALVSASGTSLTSL